MKRLIPATFVEIGAPCVFSSFWCASDLAEMIAAKCLKSARIRMAEAAIERGNITPEGKAVWRDYLAGLKADAAPSLRDALTASLAQEGEAA